MKKLYFLFMVFFVCSKADAQIKIDLTNVDDWIKANFVGQGVVIGNVKTHLAAKEAIGVFSNNGVLQLSSGLVMSTGDVRRIPGLNDKYNESTGFNNSGQAEKDPDLQQIEKAPLYDISAIEFDFVPYNNSISFNYQFGSDEYPEYVGSAFNDVFAFIVSDGESSKNIALIPGKNTPVSINTVNYKTNAKYFIDNNVFSLKTIKRNDPNLGTEEIYRTFVGGVLYSIKRFFVGRSEEEKEADEMVVEPDDDLIKKVNDKLYRNLQFDGITSKLVAQTFVEPYKKYHLKIIISDVSDNIYDSGVFLEKGSFTTIKDPSQPGFVDYPDLSKQINVQRILNGEQLKDILGQNDNNAIQQQTDPQNTVQDISNNYLIYFDFDKAQISEAENIKISRLANIYKGLGNGYSVQITAHTDSIGSLHYNLKLAAKRGQAVADCLKSITPGIGNIKLINKAYLVPAANNETEEGRAKNRRVEVKFIKIRK